MARTNVRVILPEKGERKKVIKVMKKDVRKLEEMKKGTRRLSEIDKERNKLKKVST